MHRLRALLIPITGLGRNTAKILWGGLLSAVLAVGIDRLLILVERTNEKTTS